jgi:hypothetical protein
MRARAWRILGGREAITTGDAEGTQGKTENGECAIGCTDAFGDSV